MIDYSAHPTQLWPSPEQSLLLRAALLDGEAAILAFQTWRRGIDLDAEFERPVMRLLPLVYANLLRLGVDDPLMGRLKGVYRLAWCENQRLFHALRPLLAHLRAGGVELLLLKGVPLVLGYYASYALRPMADIDVAIRPEQLPLALRLIREQGWQPDKEPNADDLRYWHTVFCAKGHHEFDLHYHLLRECVDPTADHAFWAGVEPLDFLGIETLQLDPARQLFHVILHGLRWNEETPIRWIPDALTIIRVRGGDIDWDGLLNFAAERGLGYRLALGLDYLARNFELELPPAIRARVAAARPTWRERIENTVVLNDYLGWYNHPVGKQWVIFANYCRCAGPVGPREFLVGYFHYLRYAWGLRGRREILPVMLRGLWRRLPGLGARC